MKSYYQSEVRGMFFHTVWFRNPQWSTMIPICVEHGINMFVIEGARGNVMNKPIYPPLVDAVSTIHNAGFKTHMLILCGLNPQAIINALGYHDIKTVRPDGTEFNWLCFVKPDSRMLFKKYVEDLVQLYNVDGIMFDYVRYNGDILCYCDYCRDDFIAKTGLSDTIWPTDCVWGGKYYWKWVEWRMDSITEFIEICVNAARAKNPDVEISCSPMTAFSNNSNYHGMKGGIHVADWIRRGLLDFACAMGYQFAVTGPSSQNDFIQSCQNRYFGARTDYNQDVCSPANNPGVIPYIKFVGTDLNGNTPANFAAQINCLRTNKVDGGFVNWRYGGPGLDNSNDVRPFLTALNLPPTFTLDNIQMTPNGTFTTISWTTSLPATSKVEYSENPIFAAVEGSRDFGRDFFYYDINYVGGTIIEDLAPKTTHSITVPLSKTFFHFRIISEDANGLVATHVMLSSLTPITPPPPPPKRPFGWDFPLLSWLVSRIRERSPFRKPS